MRIKEAVTQIRNIRKDKNIPNKDQVEVLVNSPSGAYSKQFESILVKLANLSAISSTSQKVENAESFMVLSTEFYVVTGVKLDVEAELKRINEELVYTKGFLNSVIKKLSNERFVGSAPEQVVAMEKKKQADAEAKIKALEERLDSLK
jgi:valyl-tRNA synthetase